MSKFNWDTFWLGFITMGIISLILLFIIVFTFNPLSDYTNKLTREVDYWNDMWAECEFGDKNYNFVHREYGKLPLTTNQ